MDRTWFIGSVIVVTGIGLVAAGDQGSRASISHARLGEAIDVTGRLGVPLGEVVTIEATVVIDAESNTKDRPGSLRVTKAGDDAVVPPAEFEMPGDAERFGVRVENGRKLRLRAYETGGFYGTPAAAWKETDPRHVEVQRPDDGIDFRFRTHLILVRSPDPDAKRNPAK